MSARVLYVLKRYPRLSETFIVNEVRALERLGVDIEIVSLMQPEPGERHDIVRDVSANVEYFSSNAFVRGWRLACAHVAATFANPAGYARALMAALAWTPEFPRPFSLWKHFWRAAYVASIARRRRHVRMHAHFAHGPSTVAHFASLMTGIPFSFTAHAKDLYLSAPATIARRVASAAFVATCTQYNVEYIQTRIHASDRSKVVRVYHGIDLAPFQALAHSQRLHGSAEPRLLSVGRLVEKKGMDDVVRACAVLRDRGMAFTCTIVGSGALCESLQQLIDQLDLGDRVTLERAMPHERLRNVLARADAFVLASTIAEDGDRDGIPNVLVEAAAAGVPIVTTAISGIPELVDEGVTGLLVEPRSPSMLAEAIRATLSAPHAAKSRAVAAGTFVAKHFDVWRNAEKLAALFNGSAS